MVNIMKNVRGLEVTWLSGRIGGYGAQFIYVLI